MKNTELFDILGNIDDKFYDEVLGGDSEKPMEIRIKNPAFSIKNVLMPVAACLAVAAGIGVTAHFLNKADLINPNPSTSDMGSQFDPRISDSDIEELMKELDERYARYDGTVPYFTALLDIDLDGYDEFLFEPNVLDSRDSHILIYEKTEDGLTRSGSITDSRISLNILHKYDADGEQYWYYYYEELFYDFSNGSGTDMMHYDSVNRINCENGEYSIDYPLCYGYTYDCNDKSSLPKQWFFKTDVSSPREIRDFENSDLTPEEFKTRWEKHTDLPEFEYFTTFEEEYPLLSEVEIPVVDSVYRPDKSVDKARLMSIEIDGGYELWLTANSLFKGNDDTDPNRFWAFSLGLCMVKDGKIVSTDGVNFMSNAHDGAAMFYLDPDEIGSFFKLYHLDDCDILVFGMVNREEFGWESNFFGIKDGVVTKLFGNDGNGWFINAPLDLENGGYNILIDAENSIRYEFHPDDFGGNPYEKPHVIKSDYISTNDYPMYNGKAAEKVTLCKKEIGGETVRLLAHNAEPVTIDGVERVKFSELFLSMDASKGTTGWVKPVNAPGSLPASKLDECLVPIVFNEGKPNHKELIVIFWGLEKVSPTGLKYDTAVFHSAENGEPFHMGGFNGAIIPSGDPCELGEFTVHSEGYMIDLKDFPGEHIVFDFETYKFLDAQE